LSRLVAGGDLKPDDVRNYSDCDSGDDSRARLSSGGADGECYQVEYDSIDIIEFAPLLMLGAAQEKAQELIAQAEAEAEQIRESARQQGAAEGREEVKRSMLPSLVAFADAGQSLIVFEEKLIALYEPHLVQLALEIAEKVIGRVVDVDDQVITSVLERARAEAAVPLRSWQRWISAEAGAAWKANQALSMRLFPLNSTKFRDNYSIMKWLAFTAAEAQRYRRPIDPRFSLHLHV